MGGGASLSGRAQEGSYALRPGCGAVPCPGSDSSALWCRGPVPHAQPSASRGHVKGKGLNCKAYRVRGAAKNAWSSACGTVDRRHGSLITQSMDFEPDSRPEGEAEHRREHVDPSRSAARFHSNFVGGATFEGVLIERSSRNPPPAPIPLKCRKAKPNPLRAPCWRDCIAHFTRFAYHVCECFAATRPAPLAPCT